MLQAKPRSLSRPVQSALIEDYLTDTARWHSVQQPMKETSVELPRLPNTEHVTHFGRSAPSVGIAASTSGTPAHLEVYDRLMRDAQSQKSMGTFQGLSSPHRSLPALPSRPVRKKWGLSSAYARARSSQITQTPDLVPRRAPRVYETPPPGSWVDVGMQCEGPDQPAYYERYIPASRNASSAVKSEPTWYDPAGYLDPPEDPINVHRVLVKPYMCWGSGFRAPSKNESYEEELRRQESLTAVLHMPSRVSPRARSRREPKLKPKAPQTSNVDDGKRYVNFCSALPFRKSSPVKRKPMTSHPAFAGPNLLRTSPIQPYPRGS